jgi:hypothetical protein
MGCIEAADEFVAFKCGEFRKAWIFFKKLKRHFWKSIKWGRSNANDSPQLGSAEAPACLLDGVVMFGVWSAREPGESANSTPNVQASNDMRVCQFTQDILV